MAIVYKSIKERYDDVAGKWTAGTDNIKSGIVAVSQNTTGATNQGTTVEVLLASNLDNMDTSNVLAFNPMAGSVPIANSDNTKAYNGNLAKLLNPNYGLGVNLLTGDQIEYPASCCDISKDFTIISFKKINVKSSTNVTYLIPSKDYGILWTTQPANDAPYSLFGNVSGNGWQGSPKSIQRKLDDGKYHCYAMKKKDLVITLLIDDVIVDTFSLSENCGNSSTPFIIVSQSSGTSIFEGMTLFANYALPDQELTDIYNCGRPDRAILPEYMKWGSNSDINSGYDFTTWSAIGCTATTNSFTSPDTGGVQKLEALTIGKKYRYTMSITNSSNLNIWNEAVLKALEPGTHEIVIEFIAVVPSIYLQNSSSGTTTITEFEIIELGVLCDLEPSGIVCNSSGKVTAWTDSSDNNNDATVSGTSDLALVKAEDYVGEGIINSVSKRGYPVNYTTASPTLILDAGSVCEYVTVKNNSANSLTISVGTSAGGTQLVNSQTVATGAKKSFACTLSDVYESSSTIYITASGTGLDYDVNLVQRRV